MASLPRAHPDFRQSLFPLPTAHPVNWICACERSGYFSPTIYYLTFPTESDKYFLAPRFEAGSCGFFGQSDTGRHDVSRGLGGLFLYDLSLELLWQHGKNMHWVATAFSARAWEHGVDLNPAYNLEPRPANLQPDRIIWDTTGLKPVENWAESVGVRINAWGFFFPQWFVTQHYFANSWLIQWTRVLTNINLAPPATTMLRKVLWVIFPISVPFLLCPSLPYT